MQYILDISMHPTYTETKKNKNKVMDANTASAH